MSSMATYLSLALNGLLLCFLLWREFLYSKVKKILDSVESPIWVKNKKDVMIYHNRSFEEIFSSDQEEASSFFDPPKFNEKLEQKSLIVRGERRIYNFYERFHGSLRIFWGSDQTQTNQLSQELKHHAEAYRVVLETLSAGITVYGKDKRLKFYNHSYTRMFDFDSNWLGTEPTLGEVIDDLASRRLMTEHADHQAYRREEMKKITSDLLPSEEMVHLPDGRSYRKITSPHPMGGSFYIFEDVTSSLNLQRQYNTQLAVQKASLDNLHEGVAVFGSDNRLRLMNPAFKNLWHKKSKILAEGRHIFELLDAIRSLLSHEGTWTDYKEKIIISLTDRIPKSLKIHTRDQRVIIVSYVPMPDGSHLMLFKDVTHSHQVEKLLREKNEALETTDRLKTEFITSVSYELRNPLQAILGFSELLKSQDFGPLNKRQISFCDHILKANDTLLGFVNTILDIASFESGGAVLKREDFDPLVQIHEALDLVQKDFLASKDQLSVDLDDHFGSIHADPERFKQMILSLLLLGPQNAVLDQRIQFEGKIKEKKFFFAITYHPANASGYEESSSLNFTLLNSLIHLHKGTLKKNRIRDRMQFSIEIPKRRFETKAEAA